jgi:hypothetical protein
MYERMYERMYVLIEFWDTFEGTFKNSQCKKFTWQIHYYPSPMSNWLLAGSESISTR